MKSSSAITDKLKAYREKDTPKGAITKANIEDHREKTLESAKKFKYPMQQARHIILVTASVVAVAATVGFIIISWWQLYTAQTTSNFYYTATKIIPLAVAEVDSEPVNYGGYLRRVRASIHYLEDQENRNFSTEDGKRELAHIKRVNLDEAEKSAFATKIARANNLTVTNDEIQVNINATLNSQDGGVISERAFENSLWRYYGWSLDDYRQIVRERLILRKAAFVTDDKAKLRINNVKSQLDSGADFAEVARAESDDETTKTSGGDVGVININNVDDNGLIDAAKRLGVGQVSGIINGVDAYYIIKLVGKNDTGIQYSVIKIGLTEFAEQFDNLRQQDKIQEYIEISEEE
ncbi:MAG: peptidylprolyl isomerase [Candidatus Nomurabacteria bacterium]|jgi:parvulin-like peptidyl-prolyl isomerase|nr:peptidylprolyl isomerase [Candidatus Nomurabacteria bacterium]